MKIVPSKNREAVRKISKVGEFEYILEVGRDGKVGAHLGADYA